MKKKSKIIFKVVIVNKDHDVRDTIHLCSCCYHMMTPVEKSVLIYAVQWYSVD